MTVDTTELALIQQDLAVAVCDKTCVIQRATKTPDGYGSESESYRPIATTVAGMKEPTANMLQNYAFRIESLAAFLVHLPVGTDVAVDDYLVVDGQTLKVHVLLTPQSYQGLLQVIAAELKP